MPSATRPRRGVALIMALLGIVLIAAIISGAFFASTQEFRSGRNMLVEQRALAVSEYGLNSEIAAWDPGRNLPGGLAVGEVDDKPVYVAAGDSANVSITRLNPTSFLVVSTGRANIPQPMLRSARKTSAYVRLAYPDIEPKGAITTRGDLTVQGSAKVDGTNRIPTGWGNCAGYPTDAVPGVYAQPTAKIEEKGAGDITSG
ncbi:MAG TPA: pilus assembly PilX N-terminal domain-containing protein, partial [Gemmatimonadaceae bacterium]|nr:pilus assembly PilX N-terminal domain-containing protein [Gemmatimonadaceae bacterium]